MEDHRKMYLRRTTHMGEILKNIFKVIGRLKDENSCQGCYLLPSFTFEQQPARLSLIIDSVFCYLESRYLKITSRRYLFRRARVQV